jgi:hypothetical protein
LTCASAAPVEHEEDGRDDEDHDARHEDGVAPALVVVEAADEDEDR